MPPIRPVRFHFTVALVSVLVLAVALWYFLGSKLGWLPILLSWFLSISAVSFLEYGYDKLRAKRQECRVPEVVLHTLSALGGSIGAWVGMITFRHKTIKGSFRILFWSIVVLQALLIAWVVKSLYWP